MKEITLEAKISNIEKVTHFVEEFLEEVSAPLKTQTQINVAIDELFSNIAHYAYGEEGGEATIRVSVTNNPQKVEVVFIDNGVPYNPLEKEDPDIALSAEERQIGGLGIFMVKKLMDDIDYKYTDGKNILTIKKIF